VKEVLPLLAKFKGAALNLLFPQKCLGCGEEGELLCPNCLKHLPRIIPPICPKCGRPHSNDLLCPACIAYASNNSSSIDGIRSPLRFHGLVREAIHQFKYKNLSSLARPLSNFLADYLIRNPIPFQVLVPVPLHTRRLRERGYNQSFLLALELSRQLNLPLIDDSLVRVKYLSPQAKTSCLEERLSNVKQAFSVHGSRLSQEKVLLIDDVSTSGATLEACAAVLKTAGAASVWGLTLARDI
jgi:ComF family protein